MRSGRDWFILNTGDVSGPWTQQEAEAYLISQRESQIWKKGQNEWMSSEAWLKKYYYNDSTKAEALPESLYHFKDDQKQLSQISLSTLISQLKDHPNLSQVYICKEGETVWKESYTFPEITEALGISRRKSPRVPLLGTLTLTAERFEKSFSAVVISEGGLGITQAHGLNIGQKYEGTLESSSLNFPLSIQFEVIFRAPNGYAGLQFVDLGDEALGIILDYISKFQHP